jgi:hypothetical protein
MGYAEVIHKKRREELKKWTSVRDIKNNGYSNSRLKKEEKREKKKMNKIAHVLLQSYF